MYIIRKQKQQAASQQYFTVILSDILHQFTNYILSMFLILMKIVYCIRDIGTTKIFVVYEYFFMKYQLSIFFYIYFLLRK